MNNYVYVEIPFVEDPPLRYATNLTYAAVLLVMYKTPVEKYIKDRLIPSIRYLYWDYVGVLPVAYDSDDKFNGTPHVAFADDDDGDYLSEPISNFTKLPASVLDDWIKKHSITL